MLVWFVLSTPVYLGPVAVQSAIDSAGLAQRWEALAGQAALGLVLALVSAALWMAMLLVLAAAWRQVLPPPADGAPGSPSDRSAAG